MSSRTRYIVGCSFGKDSLATIIIAKENGEPLDEAVYCEVMFDDGISGEVPEHRDFIYNVGIPTLESWGIKTTVIRGKRTYVSSFTRTIEKGPHAGKINAFPLCGRCCIQRDCKTRVIEKWTRSLKGDVVQYIGLAADEQERLLKKAFKNTFLCSISTELQNPIHTRFASGTACYPLFMSLLLAAGVSFARTQRSRSSGTCTTITRSCGGEC